MLKIFKVTEGICEVFEQDEVGNTVRVLGVFPDEMAAQIFINAQVQAPAQVQGGEPDGKVEGIGTIPEKPGRGRKKVVK